MASIRAVLVAILATIALVLCPAATAEPGSLSYEMGRQVIDDANRQSPLKPDGDLEHYCETLLKFELKTGQIAQVDSGSDFIAGCEDEGRALLAAS
jgi:hypothetical protein